MKITTKWEDLNRLGWVLEVIASNGLPRMHSHDVLDVVSSASMSGTHGSGGRWGNNSLREGKIAPEWGDLRGLY